MKIFKLVSNMFVIHLELITEQLKEQKLKNELNGYMLEDLKGVINIINRYPICADDVEILTKHFLYLCERKALHGKDLKIYLTRNFKKEDL